MSERVEVLGLKEVLKSLESLQPELRRKSMAFGASAGASVIKRKIMTQAPEGKTGVLKRSIALKRMSKSLAKKSGIIGSMVYIRSGNSRTKKQKAAGTDAWYWIFQEYGWYAGGRWRKRKKLLGRDRAGRDVFGGEKLDANKGLTRAGFRAKNKRERTKIKGKHFIKNSFDSTKNKVMQAYEKRIAKQVEKYRGS
ncbi:MAG: hypothetical protein GY694_09825 [Gammaproteobacteria bacterium]|nr:hypothetical protein [Gammaproteobacteria bacterium]